MNPGYRRRRVKAKGIENRFNIKIAENYHS
jgi:hypothetical protein